MSGNGGSSPPDPADLPIVYAIRILPRAKRDIEEIVSQMMDTAGAAAKAWEDGLFAALRTLSQNPRRYPIIPEPFPIEVRQMLYPPAPRAGHRVLFHVRDASDDGPIVAVLHVRHTRARPISRTEARTILAQNEIPPA
jgi:plasmid stabilization system protein ParE